MAQEVVAAEAKLVVRLDVKQAEAELDRLSQRRPPGEGGQQPPGAPGVPSGPGGTPPADRDPSGQGSRSPHQAPDSAFDWRQRGRELYGRAKTGYNVVTGGGLYDEVVRFGRSLGTVGPIPIGAAVQTAEMVRQYGPEASAFTGQFARNLGVPQEIVDRIQEQVHDLAVELQLLKVKSQAIAPAVQGMKALAVAKAKSNGTLGVGDVADLKDFGLRMFEAESLFAELDSRRSIMVREMVGGALADLLVNTTKGAIGR